MCITPRTSKAPDASCPYKGNKWFFFCPFWQHCDTATTDPTNSITGARPEPDSPLSDLPDLKNAAMSAASFAASSNPSPALMAGAACAATATDILKRFASYDWYLGAQSDPVIQSRLLSLSERPPPPFWPRRENPGDRSAALPSWDERAARRRRRWCWRRRRKRGVIVGKAEVNERRRMRAGGYSVSSSGWGWDILGFRIWEVLVHCAPPKLNVRHNTSGPLSALHSAVPRRGNYCSRLMLRFNEIPSQHFIAAVARLSSLKRAHVKRNASTWFHSCATDFSSLAWLVHAGNIPSSAGKGEWVRNMRNMKIPSSSNDEEDVRVWCHLPHKSNPVLDSGGQVKGRWRAAI